MAGVSTNAFSCLYACTIHKVANVFNCMADSMIFSQTISNSLALMVAIIFIGQLVGLIFFVLTRMVYLWFLVGVSPIAFVLSAMPDKGIKGIYDKWLSLFQANLIKLPAIAFATYFILNIMIFISNKAMLEPVQSGQVLVHTLGIVFLLIILSQGLLMAAQSLGVEQIAS
jgi:hypothetical protein